MGCSSSKQAEAATPPRGAASVASTAASSQQSQPKRQKQKQCRPSRGNASSFVSSSKQRGGGTANKLNYQKLTGGEPEEKSRPLGTTKRREVEMSPAAVQPRPGNSNRPRRPSAERRHSDRRVVPDGRHVRDAASGGGSTAPEIVAASTRRSPLRASSPRQVLPPREPAKEETAERRKDVVTPIPSAGSSGNDGENSRCQPVWPAAGQDVSPSGNGGVEESGVCGSPEVEETVKKAAPASAAEDHLVQTGAEEEAEAGTASEAHGDTTSSGRPKGSNLSVTTGEGASTGEGIDAIAPAAVHSSRLVIGGGITATDDHRQNAVEMTCAPSSGHQQQPHVGKRSDNKVQIRPEMVDDTTTDFFPEEIQDQERELADQKMTGGIAGNCQNQEETVQPEFNGVTYGPQEDQEKDNAEKHQRPLQDHQDETTIPGQNNNACSSHITAKPETNSEGNDADTDEAAMLLLLDTSELRDEQDEDVADPQQPPRDQDISTIQCQGNALSQVAADPDTSPEGDNTQPKEENLLLLASSASDSESPPLLQEDATEEMTTQQQLRVFSPSPPPERYPASASPSSSISLSGSSSSNGSYLVDSPPAPRRRACSPSPNGRGPPPSAALRGRSPPPSWRAEDLEWRAPPSSRSVRRRTFSGGTNLSLRSLRSRPAFSPDRSLGRGGDGDGFRRDEEGGGCGRRERGRSPTERSNGGSRSRSCSLDENEEEGRSIGAATDASSSAERDGIDAHGKADVFLDLSSSFISYSAPVCPAPPSLAGMDRPSSPLAGEEVGVLLMAEDSTVCRGSDISIQQSTLLRRHSSSEESRGAFEIMNISSPSHTPNRLSPSNRRSFASGSSGATHYTNNISVGGLSLRVATAILRASEEEEERGIDDLFVAEEDEELPRSEEEGSGNVGGDMEDKALLAERFVEDFREEEKEDEKEEEAIGKREFRPSSVVLRSFPSESSLVSDIVDSVPQSPVMDASSADDRSGSGSGSTNASRVGDSVSKSASNQTPHRSINRGSYRMEHSTTAAGWGGWPNVVDESPSSLPAKFTHESMPSIQIPLLSDADVSRGAFPREAISTGVEGECEENVLGGKVFRNILENCHNKLGKSLMEERGHALLERASATASVSSSKRQVLVRQYSSALPRSIRSNCPGTLDNEFFGSEIATEVGMEDITGEAMDLPIPSSIREASSRHSQPSNDDIISSRRMPRGREGTYMFHGNASRIGLSRRTLEADSDLDNCCAATVTSSEKGVHQGRIFPISIRPRPKAVLVEPVRRQSASCHSHSSAISDMVDSTSSVWKGEQRQIARTAATGVKHKRESNSLSSGSSTEDLRFADIAGPDGTPLAQFNPTGTGSVAFESDFIAFV